MKNKKGAGVEIYSNPEADELSKHYGTGFSDELSKILCEKLAIEIDRSIRKKLGRGLGIKPDRNKRRMNSINKIFISSE